MLNQRQLSITKGHSPTVASNGRPKNAEYHLTRRQLAAVLAAAPEGRDRTLIALMAETGMRRCEVAALEVTDLRLTESLLVVRNGKGGKSRLIPLSERLVVLLRHHLDGRTVGPVFLSRLGRQLCTRQLNRIVQQVGRLAGVNHPDPRRPGLTCHLFRHTFARLWKDAGGSIETLSSILGHASQTTTLDLYGREGLSDIRTNYAKTMKKIGM